MQVEFKIPEEKHLKYNELKDGETYICTTADYKGDILYGMRYGEFFGIWLTLIGVLSVFTKGKEDLEFKKFNCKLVETE